MAQRPLSQSYAAKKSRIKRLARLLPRTVDAFAKRDAQEVERFFREGIARDQFRLNRLAESTIRRKRRKGYPRPKTPLYGKGGDRSYQQMMNVTKRGQSWVVRPSTATHHSGRIKLSTLFRVHEFGTTIRQKGRTIRIPPRPALQKAYNKHLRRKRRQDPAAEVRSAINELINTGNAARLREIERRR